MSTTTLTKGDGIRQLAELLRAARRVVAFTGAGISTGSGIPDFRGPAGVWTKRSPVYFQDFVASESARVDYWEFKLEGAAAFRDARPNAAHQALVEMERSGQLLRVVTQNVDGLHQAAGSSAEHLIELHGSNASTVCLGCDKREPIAPALLAFERTRQPPTCRDCGELLKPGVVMFGEALDLAALRQAMQDAADCDLMLALGSSLVVTPAADVPRRAAERRTPYVIVNRGETPQDALASFCIDADVSEVIPAALAASMPTSAK
ncbi:MAG: Sir2 family NAD-dependent protein deacetylase [Polyangiaceae bacterium]